MASRRVLPCLLALLLVAAPLAAQKRAAAPPDPARLTLARRVLELNGSVDAMIAAIRASIPAQRQATPQLPAEFWDRFEARVTRDAPQLIDSIAVLYAAQFSQEDLQALVAFYGTPTGQRLRQFQSTLIAESSAIGQRWGARIGAEIGAALEIR